MIAIRKLPLSRVAFEHGQGKIETSRVVLDSIEMHERFRRQALPCEHNMPTFYTLKRSIYIQYTLQ
jgi:hypothetical protein